MTRTKKTVIAAALVLVLLSVGSLFLPNGSETDNGNQPVEINANQDIKFPPIDIGLPKKYIKPLVLDVRRTLILDGPISGNALQAANIIAELNASLDPIYIVLSSPGGSVVAGQALIAAIQASKAPVYTVCYALCASMASMIHQYGKRRFMTDKSIIMFHPASSSLEGNMDNLYNFVRAMIKYIANLEFDVARRIGWSFQQYKEYTNTGLWINSDEAKTYNVADEIVYLRFNKSILSFSSQEEMRKKATLVGEANVTNNKGNDVIWIYKGRL